MEHKQIANTNKQSLFSSVSFLADVYWARQQALYCGMKASTTQALSKLLEGLIDHSRSSHSKLRWLIRGQLTGGHLQATERVAHQVPLCQPI